MGEVSLRVAKRFRIAEIFGPTIQGEGRHAGTPCYFIRFGGCDYRCSWCDTPYAVLPELVAQLEQMEEEKIIGFLKELPPGPRWVVLSGGNPALFELGDLISELQRYYEVMIETQGSVWKEWLARVDELCISPKPPSSGMDPSTNLLDFLDDAMAARIPPSWAYLKVVIFNDSDYIWAKTLHHMYPRFDFFLSVGNTDPGLATVANPTPNQQSVPLLVTQQVVLNKTRWLFEKVAQDPDMSDVRVIPQLHTLVWGNARGR